MAKETKEQLFHLGTRWKHNLMVDMDLNISAVTLKVSGLEAPSKVQRLIFGFF